MPSSTSSSEMDHPIPEVPLGRALALALVLSAVVLVAWERHWRAEGYPAALDDTPDLFATAFERVGEEPGQTVVIGASRARFDLDLDVLEEETGWPRAIQLAMNGACARPVLARLAADERFAGRLVVSVTPSVFFAGFGPMLARTEEWLLHLDRWTPAERISSRLWMPLDERLVFLNQDDLTLQALVHRLHLPERPGGRYRPRLPPMLATVDRERREWMLPKLEQDAAFQAEVQQIWLGLILPPFAPDEAGLDRMMEAIARDVKAIRSRGGRVVFIAPPSTDRFRESEAVHYPRDRYWDRMLAASGALGIHFEDHPELSGFTCPEWSHLTREDARTYTRRLAPLLVEVLDRK